MTRLDYGHAQRARQLRQLENREPAWWIIFGRKGSRCSSCGHETYGQPAALEFTSQTLYCKVCWERFQLHPKPSKGYVQGLRSAAARERAGNGRTARRRRKRSSRPREGGQAQP